MRPPRQARRRSQCWVLLLAAVVGVMASAGCSSETDPRRASTTRPSLDSSTSTTPPSTATPQPPSAGGGSAPGALEVTGRSSSGATIEMTFDDARSPVTAQADSNGDYSFLVTTLRQGENIMFVAAHPLGQPGLHTNFAARFTIRRSATSTSTAVTCASVIEVTLNLDSAPDLRVVC